MKRLDNQWKEALQLWIAIAITASVYFIFVMIVNVNKS